MRPAPLGGRAFVHMSPMRPLDLYCFLIGTGHVAVRMQTDTQLRIPILVERSFIEVDQRCESDRGTADDGQHQRQPVASGPYDRLRAASNADPRGQMSLRELGTEGLIG